MCQGVWAVLGEATHSEGRPTRLGRGMVLAWRWGGVQGSEVRVHDKGRLRVHDEGRLRVHDEGQVRVHDEGQVRLHDD